MGMMSGLKRIVWTAAPEGLVASEEINDLRQQVDGLTHDVERLKKEVDEARRDSLRIAELYDLVVESLSKP